MNRPEKDKCHVHKLFHLFIQQLLSTYSVQSWARCFRGLEDESDTGPLQRSKYKLVQMTGDQVMCIEVILYMFFSLQISVSYCLVQVKS